MEVILIAALFIGGLLLIIGFILGKFFGAQYTHFQWKNRVQDIRDDAIKRSRSVLGGQFSEQLAPYLPHFPYAPTEVRFLGKPVDFIVFKGMDNHSIDEVIFVEVKSGCSGLNERERSLREAIMQKRVSWQEYRIPEKLTKKE